ncbi:unnamed protein product, partial [Ixodes pacificus]
VSLVFDGFIAFPGGCSFLTVRRRLLRDQDSEGQRGTRDGPEEDLLQVGQLSPGASQLPHHGPHHGHAGRQDAHQAPGDPVRRETAKADQGQDEDPLPG